MSVWAIWISIPFWNRDMTIRDVLKSAFAYLFDLEAQMNAYL